MPLNCVGCRESKSKSLTLVVKVAFSGGNGNSPSASSPQPTWSWPGGKPQASYRFLLVAFSVIENKPLAKCPTHLWYESRKSEKRAILCRSHSTTLSHLRARTRCFFLHKKWQSEMRVGMLTSIHCVCVQVRLQDVCWRRSTRWTLAMLGLTKNRESGRRSCIFRNPAKRVGAAPEHCLADASDCAQSECGTRPSLGSCQIIFDITISLRRYGQRTWASRARTSRPFGCHSLSLEDTASRACSLLPGPWLRHICSDIARRERAAPQPLQ